MTMYVVNERPVPDTAKGWRVFQVTMNVGSFPMRLAFDKDTRELKMYVTEKLEDFATVTRSFLVVETDQECRLIGHGQYLGSANLGAVPDVHLWELMTPLASLLTPEELADVV